MFAVQAWCAPTARAMAITAIHSPLALAAKITPMMVQAKISIENSRAVVARTPRPISQEERMPPPMLPKSAVSQISISGMPIWVTLMPRLYCWLRNGGSQYR
ncbi:hypothetical protein D3C81_2036450 [compost metagenome]